MIGVKETSQSFVDVVPRNPVSVEVKALASDIARFKFGKDALCVGHTAYKAISVGFLALGEFLYDELSSRLEIVVTGRGEH